MSRRDTIEDEVISIPPDAELERPFSDNEITPRARVCPDCGDDQVDAGGGTPLPETREEACAIVRCWGTSDRMGARWCRTKFTATWPSEGKSVSFDRRKVKR